MRNVIALVTMAVTVGVAAAATDVEGSKDHPAISRYPGSEIAWYRVENFMKYRIAVGPETGYRVIDDWIDTEGRVTRIFYRLAGERTQTEVWKNYRDAIAAAGFDIAVEAVDSAKATDPAGRSWYVTATAPNDPKARNAAVRDMGHGTSTSGGRGVVVGKKARAEGNLWVVVHTYQHSATEVLTLIDVVEEKAAETGLVTANTDAMGEDILEQGRTVLEGLFFDHDKATLKPESKPALVEIARFLKEKQPAMRFFVVGHTDLTGAFDYNAKLSADRAAAVVEALVSNHGIARERLKAQGVGPLAPVFTNASEAGRGANRRVELVQASLPQ